MAAACPAGLVAAADGGGALMDVARALVAKAESLGIDSSGIEELARALLRDARERGVEPAMIECIRGYTDALGDRTAEFVFLQEVKSKYMRNER